MTKIYNVDCTEQMKSIEKESIDLVITSPPYDEIRTYNNSSTWDFEKYKQVMNGLYKVLKVGGVIVWIVSDQTINGNESGTSFKQALYAKEIGFNLHDTMIWMKDSCAFPEKTRYAPIFEYMFVFSKEKPKTINLIEDRKNKWSSTKIHGSFRNADGILKGRSSQWKEVDIKEYGCRFNVWEQPTEKNNDSGHPAVFPQQLVIDHILSWSNEKDLVFDPFLGSGTTGIACVKTNRNFIGTEIDKQYFEIAKNRIEIEENQLRLF